MSIIERFNEFLGQYTYRQRFVFWAFLYFTAVPFPNYSIIQALNRHIGRIDQQQEGIQEERRFWNVSNAFLISDIRSHVTKDVSPTVKFDILTQSMKQITQAYQLLSLDDELESQLSQLIHTAIWQDQVSIVQLTRSLEDIMARRDFSKETIETKLEEVTAFRIHFEETISRLNSLYRYINLYRVNIGLHVALIREIAEEARLKNVQFANTAKETLLSLEKELQPGPAPGIDFRSTAVEAVRTLGDCRDIAAGIFGLLLKQDRDFYWWLRLVVIGAFCFVSLVAIFYVVFHVLTGHLLRLLEYIKDLTKERFIGTLHGQRGDEVGEITLAFHQLGQTVERIIFELQSSSKRLRDAGKKCTGALVLQRKAISKQKDGLGELQAAHALTNAVLFELSEIVKGFGSAAGRRSIDHSARIRLNRMLENMAVQTDASFDIVGMLAGLQKSILSIRTLFEFMAKTSDDVSIIAINSAIEAASGRQYRQELENIALKIRRFADMTAESGVMIMKKIDDMAASVVDVKKTAKSCVKEIGRGGNRLIVVGGQVSSIAHRGEEHFVDVQIVDATLQDLIEGAMRTLTILGQLRESIRGSQHSFREAEKAAARLNGDIHQLCKLTSVFATERGEKR